MADAAVEYLAARLRLEGYKLEEAGAALLRRLWLLLAASAVALLGLVFFSLGVAVWISSRLRSQPAGLLAVGAIYVLIGILVATIAGRSRRDGRG